MPSPAFLKFGDRILEVKRLLALCTPEDADARVRRDDYKRDNALLRAAHVLLCSHLEGFVEDLVADAIDAYDKLTDKIAKVPDELRARQVMGAESKWEIKDSSKRWKRIKDCTAHPLMRPDGTKSPGCLEPELHTDGFANPGSGEIASIFESIGINDLWSQFESRENNKIYIKSLDAIVNRRNQIAHGKAEALITLSDSKEYASRAERITEIFDQIVTSEIASRLEVGDCWLALEKQAELIIVNSVST